MMRWRNMSRWIAGAVAAAACAFMGCNAPAPAPSTGGANLPDGPCGRGLVLISSDYQSSNVSVLDTDGSLVSASIVSSASEASALSAPLSGDVVLPNARMMGDDIVLIDRYPAAVLTWVDVQRGEVRAQLDVSTQFAANPRDYLPLGDGRAYVTRFQTNPFPGATAFDGGGDILILDVAEPAIIGRIDLSTALQDTPGFLPRASRMVQLGDVVYVLLVSYNQDFSDAAPSRLVRVATESDTIVGVTVLEDFYGCEGLAAQGDRIAIACSGLLAGGATSSTEGSGLILTDAQGQIFSATPARDLIGQPLGFSAAFTRTGVLVTALGAFANDGGEDTRDAVVHVGANGSVTTVVRSSSRPFDLGEVRCSLGDANAACSHCFVTNGATGGLQRLDPDDGSSDVTLPIDDGIGLPTRLLGRF